MTAAYTGQLRERVLWQQRTGTTAAEGDSETTWSQGVTLYARVMPVKASEGDVADRRAASGLYEVTVRWRAGIANNDRFVWNAPKIGRAIYLAIEGIQNRDERRMFLTIICSDMSPDAGST